jgi:hypothetical protein
MSRVRVRPFPAGAIDRLIYPWRPARIYRKVRRVLASGRLKDILVTAPYSLDYVQARINGFKINLIVRQSWDRYGIPSKRECTRPEPRQQ